MNNILDNKLCNIILLFTIIGEFLVPWILKHFYKGYDSKRMVMSALGNLKSPVRNLYNLWLIYLGIFLFIIAIGYYKKAQEISSILAILIFLSISIFAIGAGVLAGLFSVNESKDVVTIGSKIHGAGAAIGFISLLFFPLLNGILALKQNNFSNGIVSIISFLFAFVFFVMFIMGDKEQFKNTILTYEGLFERTTLFCMYIPFLYRTISKLL